MAAQGEDFPANFQVPELDRFIVASGKEPLAVGQRYQVAHAALMPGKGERFLAGFQIPDPDYFVRASRIELLAVWRDREAG